jgi:hypothetical protein
MAKPTRGFFRLWIAATACWLLYMLVISTVNPFGFGLPELLITVSVPTILYLLMFFLVPWVIKGFSKFRGTQI